MKIEKLLNLERKLNLYDMYFRRFKKPQRLKLIILSILSLLLFLTGLADLHKKNIKIQIPISLNDLLSGLINYHTPLFLIGLGLVLLTTVKWYKYKNRIQERIYRVYHGTKPTATIPARITDEQIKTQITRLFLRSNNLLFQDKN